MLSLANLKSLVVSVTVVVVVASVVVVVVASVVTAVVGSPDLAGVFELHPERSVAAIVQINKKARNLLMT